MAETREIGRILPYSTAMYEEKISKFVLRVKEQIQVLRLGIQNGNVNNPQIAKSYAKKAEQFLETPFFLIEKNKDKRVKNLKRETKIDVGVRKDLIEVIEEWIQLKESQKVVTAKKFTPYNEHNDIDFVTEIMGFFNQDTEFLNTFITKYSSDSILINRLSGLLADKEFLKALGCKNSWMVSTLKKELTDWGKDQTFKAEEELEEVLKLPYFKKKEYLTMDVATFRETISVKVEIVKRILEWLNNQKFRREVCLKLVLQNKEEFKNYKLYDLFAEYSDFISTLYNDGKQLKDEYSLYRFGQGLIEADIFASLYK